MERKSRKKRKLSLSLNHIGWSRGLNTWVLQQGDNVKSEKLSMSERGVYQGTFPTNRLSVACLQLWKAQTSLLSPRQSLPLAPGREDRLPSQTPTTDCSSWKFKSEPSTDQTHSFYEHSFSIILLRNFPQISLKGWTFTTTHVGSTKQETNPSRNVRTVSVFLLKKHDSRSSKNISRGHHRSQEVTPRASWGTCCTDRCLVTSSGGGVCQCLMPMSGCH